VNTLQVSYVASDYAKDIIKVYAIY